jgi:hypothetical protein
MASSLMIKMFWIASGGGGHGGESAEVDRTCMREESGTA